MEDKRIEKIFSEKLNKEVVVEVLTVVTETDKKYEIITNKSLEKIVIDNNINYKYNFLLCDTTHSVVECIMTMPNTKDYCVSGVGESIYKNLSLKGKTMPTRMACKRAFDNAAILVLGIPMDKYCTESILSYTETEQEDDSVEAKNIISDLLNNTIKDYSEENEDKNINISDNNNNLSPILPSEDNEEGIMMASNVSDENVEQKSDDNINTIEQNIAVTNEMDRIDEANENENINEKDITVSSYTSNDEVIIDFGPAQKNPITVKEAIELPDDDKVKKQLKRLVKIIDKVPNEEQRNVLNMLVPYFA